MLETNHIFRRANLVSQLVICFSPKHCNIFLILLDFQKKAVFQQSSVISLQICSNHLRFLKSITSWGVVQMYSNLASTRPKAM
jgi:hypothetical protein